MAIITQYKEFPFNTSVDNWIATDGGSTTSAWSSVSASLQMVISGKNKTDAGNYWLYTGSWENILGYSRNDNNTSSFVLAISASYRWKCPVYTTGNAAGTNDGPFKLRNIASVDYSQVVGKTNFTAALDWQIKSGSCLISQSIQSSTASVELYLGNDLATGNSVAATVNLQQDWVKITASIQETYATGAATPTIYKIDRSGFFFP